MTVLLNGKYALDRRLGDGGMAEVFLARTVGAEGFSRPVAIKRILPYYSANPAFAAMFVSEAQLSSRLQHPNVVSVLDFDRDLEGGLFLVMELVDGVDLDGLMQTGMLPLPAIVHVVTEVLRGLGYAHQLPLSSDGVRGLVHRDVSPHNVLLSWEGAAKLSDFGIAKSRQATDATGTAYIKGKPAYMSPEQANGLPLDGRSDLFAVGVMLWEMLCGRVLFAGTTTQETLARLMFAPIPSPRSLRPDLPVDLERVTMRLLARERDQRYPDADAAITELIACRDHPRNGRELLVGLLAQRFVDRAPRRARSTAGDVAATLDTPVPLPSQTPLPTPGEGTYGTPRRRTRRVWAVPIVVVCLGLGTAVAISARRSDDAAPRPTHAPVVAPPGVAPSASEPPVPAPPEPASATSAPIKPAPAVAPTTSDITDAGSAAAKPKSGGRTRGAGKASRDRGSGSGIREIKLERTH